MKLKKIITQELPFLYVLPAILWQTLFLCVPLCIMVYTSFTYLGTPTLEFYKTFTHTPYLRIIARSLLFAVGNAFVCLVCVYPVTYFLAVYVTRWKNLLLFLLALPFWTNILVQIYAWFFLLERNGLINAFLLKVGIISEPLTLANNQWAVFLVMIYCYIPFMVLPIYSALEKLNLQLLEASADLGATPWQTFRKITWPLSLPGIKTGLLLVLVPSFGEFIIPELIGGSKYMMVGSLISYYFLSVRNNGLGAAFTVCSGIILLLVALLFYRYLQRDIPVGRE
jgi:ABC-type spermidine/putrescine transport system permease subunit I